MPVVNTLVCDGPNCSETVSTKITIGVRGDMQLDYPRDWIHLVQRARLSTSDGGGRWYFHSWSCVATWAQFRLDKRVTTTTTDE